ncbi:COX15/CtaA family protein [Thalassotalea sp. PS06]|uniref:COX15/CtaA family protein n=1 Tax=Thalassotalea sp. PS06 TaxID=2594005 RepID=UPI001164D4B7|nr:COX15/CtaA family protein [Thalassotalea sp. PS06]QDP02602.1 heme A synthase [Thalassotalea sp. PS06]
MNNNKPLLILTLILALGVISLGAYTRLTDAGLGCPDWPGCYGLIDVPKTQEQIIKAEMAFPERPVEPHKAWNEMIHRYFAGTLGLLIGLIFILSFKNREQGGPLYLPLIMLGVVIFQAALGAWTVTLKLMPIIVMGHLLGGFLTLCLLYLLLLRISKVRGSSNDAALAKYTPFAFIGIVILGLQIALGGWTSSNYAALVCQELPVCHDGWMEQLTFSESFQLIPPERETYEFGYLGAAERVTIHAMHRIGAMITFFYLAWLALTLFFKAQSATMKKASLIMGGILLIQVALGVSNVVFSLPLAVAVAHNVVAAILMLALITITYTLKPRPENAYV